MSAAAIREKALAAAEKASGPENPKVAASLVLLADLHRDNGNYEKARMLYERAAAIYEKVKSPEFLWSLTRLADFYRKCGRYAAARPLYRRILAMREGRWGSRAWVVAADLESLARLEVAQGRTAEADVLFKRVTEIAQRVQGETPIFSYDQACYSALLKNRAQAIYFLKQAIARGFDAKYKIANNPDFAYLRGDRVYETIIK